jgi:hypothetical protein
MGPLKCFHSIQNSFRARAAMAVNVKANEEADTVCVCN